MKTSRTLSRRESLRTLALGAGAFAFGSRHLFSEDKAKNPPVQEMQYVSLGEKLTLLSGGGGNILVLTGKDGGLVIDSGLPNMATTTSLEVAKAAGRPITVIINTHWHFDHVGGNQALAKEGARIFAHDNCLKRVSTTQHNDFMNRDMPALPEDARPEVTFNNEMQMHLNGEDLRLVSVDPAHTDGDIFIHFANANVIHMGDIHFNGLYPFIDYSSGGWIGGMIAGAKKALALTDEKTRIIPGHGPLAKQADLKDYVTMLETVYEKLEKAKAAGQSVDEVVAASPSKAYDEKLGQGFMKPEMFVRCSYTSLLKHT
jgi:glyoxylase-like metal-dependent hydrolase (beta-lactamase superfamily II)